MKHEKIRKAPVMLPLIFFLTFSLSFAQENTVKDYKRSDATNYFLTSSKDPGLTLQSGYSKKNLSPLAEKKNEKSPILAGLFSALVPGAGEIYSKSYIKAAAFIVIEAGMWIGYKVYQNKEADQTVYYQGVADAHWSVRRYATWLHGLNLAESGNIDPNDPSLDHLYTTIHALESVHFSHTLPAYGVQQYYELIGKYHSFVAGWDDATGNYDQNTYINWTSPLWENYAVIRQQANNYYDTSQNFVYGILINHLLSAADAVWSASIFNSNLKFSTKIQMSNQLSPVTNKWELVPTTKLAVTF